MTNLAKYILVLSLFLLGSSFNYAQQQLNWELGGFFGGANYTGDLVRSNYFVLSETHLAYGFFARRNIHKELALRINFFEGNISGNDANFQEYPDRKGRAFSFSSPIREFSLQLEWEIFGDRRYQSRWRFRPTFSPYLFVGAGLLFFDPETQFGNGAPPKPEEPIYIDQNAELTKSRFTLPFGIGFRMDVNRRWVIGIEGGLRTAFTDYLDGVSVAGDPNSNDWYGFGGVTLTYRLGKQDSDKDGIADKKDQCPKVPGLRKMGGCPDSDGDGITDQKDNCPYQSGIALLKGCPDTDGDQITDNIDKCPNEAGSLLMEGCPDRDGDNVIDKEDDCPNLPGPEARNGCPIFDKDDDGVEDEIDRCPNTPGELTNEGCPFIDTDGDGIIDDLDSCPNLPGLSSLEGCPDTDGDGVNDIKDACPDTPGEPVNRGCPPETIAPEIGLDLVVKTIFFDLQRAEIKPEAFNTLDKVATDLSIHTTVSVEINAFAGDADSQPENKVLSEERANACYSYLLAKGVSPLRIKIRTNYMDRYSSDGEKLLNRRVDFIFTQ